MGSFMCIADGKYGKIFFLDAVRLCCFIHSVPCITCNYKNYKVEIAVPSVLKIPRTKRPHPERETSQWSETVTLKQRRRVEQSEDFEAHDYSGADMNMFQGTHGCEYLSKNFLVILYFLTIQLNYTLH